MRFLLILALVLSQGPSPAVKPIANPKSASSTQQPKTESTSAKPAESFWQRTRNDPLALYTLALTVFTGALAVIAFRQDRQIRREFTTSHRPKLIVREVEYRRTEDGSEIHYTIANVGGSRARVIESNATAYTKHPSEPLPPVPPYEPKRTVRNTIIIAAGESRRPPYKDTPYDMALTIAEIFGESGARLYIMGYLIYIDDNRLKRRTAFCRLYDPDTKRFQTSSDPDYEYAD